MKQKCRGEESLGLPFSAYVGSLSTSRWGIFKIHRKLNVQKGSKESSIRLRIKNKLVLQETPF
jgi:hypothetical protein